MSAPHIVPYFSYADAEAAIVFLQSAFGFETLQSYKADDGTVIHAEMRSGNGVIMLGTDASLEKGRSPGTYVVVDDVDAHYRAAEAAGAIIVYPPEDTEFGTRRYRAKDLEGHEWSFGTYQPQLTAPNWT